MGKRKFIDPKFDKIHRYKIVPRSQQDPLIADAKAPKAVLVDILENEEVPENEKYGIYFDDDYNYIQHLKGVKETVDWQDEGESGEVYFIRALDLPKSENSKGLKLPSSAFESYVAEPIGMLHKAAPLTGPRPELDPEIVAELDDDEIDNNIGEKDFDDLMGKLNMESPNINDNSSEKSYDREDDNESCDAFFDEAMSDIGSKVSFSFTQCSTSSQCLPRSKEQEFYNDRWEAHYLRHYSNYKADTLDMESIGDYMEPADFYTSMIPPCPKKTLDDLPEDKEWNKNYILATEESRISNPYQMEQEKVRKLKFDVESYREAMNAKKQDYLDDIKKFPLTKKSLAEHTKLCNENNESEGSENDDSERLTLKTAYSLASIKDPSETNEERKERKRLFKMLKRERRVEKKQNKLLYLACKKQEAKKGFSSRVRTIPLP